MDFDVNTKKLTHLRDYQKLAFDIINIDLTFNLDDQQTHVISKVDYLKKENEPLVLNGENLILVKVILNGKELSKENYQLTETTLTFDDLPDSFTLEIHTQINPSENTSLDGLYKSGNIFCTQNEPHGFRRITYFLDRPDAMGIYTTTIIADKTKYPLLLSNGNKIGEGELPNGKHWATWNDPFKKPCYLFALVAGDLGVIEDTYITQSNRKIALKIFCDKGNEFKCWHAMNSLKKSMKWDEDTFGLEYDLDIFMIVAVDAFNFGAMENKGLNIFNTSCVLADSSTATDDNFYRVEGVIAHEYFHNWTGNRVTCRDWFQLTLKEGLTVYRDQEFSADMNSRPVKRIEDVSHLRAHQFSEDSGPTSHPIKPQSYIEINNFYTMTIYEKGAEVIRMLHTLLGDKIFKEGIKKYFELYDGQAVTTEDFLYAMEVASGRDLKEFSKWYHQSGTPHIYVSSTYDEKKKESILKIKQKTLPTQDQKEKEPLFFPLKIGLIGTKGEELTYILENSQCNCSSTVVTISKEEEEFIFKNVLEKPIFSINRDFSCPVIVHADYTQDELQFLMKHDKNEFNRWDASQELSFLLLLEEVKKAKLNQNITVESNFINNIASILKDDLDPAFKSLILTLPDENALAERQEIMQLDYNYLVIKTFYKEIGNRLYSSLSSLYHSLIEKEEYKIDPLSIGKRRLKNTCLKYLIYSENREAIEIAYNQFLQSKNMTDKFSALVFLCNTESEEKEKALDSFYKQWKDDPLVMCKWFGAQSGSKAKSTLKITKELIKHQSFNEKNPNIVRALLGSFVGNLTHFHEKTGEGYSFISDQLLKLDAINPYISSRLAIGFQKYEKLDMERKKHMSSHIDKILSQENISPNLYEIIAKCKQS